MTDEERAEQYLDKACGKFAVVVERNRIREAYLDGLKAGRKESEQEIAELKETVSRAGYRIAELKHEIDNLKEQNKIIIEDNDTLNKWVDELKELSEINSLSKVLIQRCKEVGIKDLYNLSNYLTIMENQKHQIEKMKCCENCKKERNKPEPLAVHESCTKCKKHSEWELAELEIVIVTLAVGCHVIKKDVLTVRNGKVAVARMFITT